MSTRFVSLAGALVAAAVAGGWAVGKFRATPPAPRDAAARGEVLFQIHCAGCHGPEGHGDGPSAAALRPPPRDFAARPWRFEVTPESVRRVVLDGIPGTAMPAGRSALADADVDPLVAHVLRLAAAKPAAPGGDPLLQAAEFTDLLGIATPPLSATDAAGKAVTLTDLRGKLVLLHFWGTTCDHCLKEMPALKELDAEFAARGLVVLHVGTDVDDPKEGQALADRFAAGVRVVAEVSGVGLARFDVQALPATWLVGPDGAAVARADGAKDWRSPAVRAVIERHLLR